MVFPGFSGFRPPLMNDRLDISEIKKKKKNLVTPLDWNLVHSSFTGVHYIWFTVNQVCNQALQQLIFFYISNEM